MSEPKRGIECPEHGTRDSTYVCEHLASGTGCGFHCSDDDGDDPVRLWPDAWCDSCETVRASEGGWNDRSEAFAGIRLLCDGCYQKARERNWKQDENAFSELLRDAVAYLQERQDQLFSRYDIGRYPRYDWNQETGQLVFSEDGQARVVADIQFVGSISTRADTWLWSWANESILESVRQRVRQVRAFGNDHRYLKLACPCWTAEEADGWEMTAIAVYLLGAVGAYRSPSERGFSFLAITDVRWTQ